MKKVTLLLLLVQISILRNLQLITLIDNNIKSTQILSKSGQTQEINNNVKSSVSGNPNSSALVHTRLQQILAQDQTAKQAQVKDQTKQKEDSKSTSINNISLQKITATPVLHVTQTNSTQIKQIEGQSNIHQNTTKFSVPNSITLLTVKFQQKNGSNVSKVNQIQQTHSLANTTPTNESLQVTTDQQNEQLTTLDLKKQVSVNGKDTEKTVENMSASATITNSQQSSVIKTLHASVSSQDAKTENSSKTTTENNSSTTTNSSNSTSTSQVARNSSTTVPKRKIPSPTPAKPKVVTPPKRKEDPLKTLGSAAKMQDTGLSDDLIPEGLEKDPRFKRIKNLTVATTIPKQMLDLKNIKRSFNGSGNNLEHPNWGLSNTSQARHCKVNYADGKQTPVADLPSPRQVSDAVGSVREQPQLDPQNLTLAWTIWGQFLDHDIQFSPSSSNQNQSFHIIIPKCDSFFDSDCNGGRVIPFTRSLFSLTEQGVRVPFNSLTAWIDASMVYGSNQNQTKKLRSFKGGKLRTDFSGRMLPEGKPVNSTQKNISNMTMEAGDARSNQNLILLSYQTLFLREHNRICDLLLSNFNNMVDEDIFQIARNYIIGLIQKITYDDYLPILLGPTAYQQFIGQYKGYNDKMNPTIQVQFSGAAFRFGHSLIPVAFPLVNLYGDKIQILDMDRAFFRPDLLDSFAVDRVFRGASRTITKLRDGQFVDQLRNLLILAPQIRNIRMDLLSLNIQRGRDQGLPAYNDMRQCYGLPKFKDFNQLSDDPIKNEDLANVYNNDIQKVDSYIAIQIQKGIKGSVLGQTGIAMVGRQFQKIRDGDRFWYERVYPEKIIEQIKATKLSHIIMRNTFISELQEDVFHYHFGG